MVILGHLAAESCCAILLRTTDLCSICPKSVTISQTASFHRNWMGHFPKGKSVIDPIRELNASECEARGGGASEALRLRNDGDARYPNSF